MTKSKKLAVRVGVFASAFLLVTAAGLGATMAKYAKTADTTTSSHVAQFGVNMTWSGSFASTYAKDSTNASYSSVTNSVSSTQAVIAPGTTGSITLQIDGSAEVAFTLNISLAEAYSADWKTSASGVDYHPVAITAVSQVWDANKSGGAGWSDTQTAVTLTNGAVAEIVYAPGDVTRTLYTFTWAWAFDNSAVTAGYTVNSNIYQTSSAIDYYKVNTAFTYYTATTAFDYYSITTGFTDVSSEIAYAAGDYITEEIYNTLDSNQGNCQKVQVAKNTEVSAADFAKLPETLKTNITTTTYAANDFMTTATYTALPNAHQSNCEEVQVAKDGLITSADHTKLNALSLADNCTVLHATGTEITTTTYGNLTADTKASCSAITGDVADTYMSGVSTATYALTGTVTATQID